ncbi:hypothetical protein ACIOUE_16410 [Streptomyces xanthochromogenes]|uniref:hypothetical protein n=1 Tax=Streptomyces xanthochromogenes TaxID=67384 RepID=UPI0038008E19
MAQYRDNPAGRLEKLLLDLYAATSGEQAQRQKEAWRAVVDLAGGEPSFPRQMSVVGIVVGLPRQVRESVEYLPLDEERKDHLLLHLDKVEAGMVQLATRQTLYAMFTAFATGGVVPQCAAISSLSHCSYELHHSMPEITVSDEDLARIVDLITDLMAEVAEAKLPAQVKRALLHHLTTLLQAVHDIRFAGTQPVDDALFALLGVAGRADCQEKASADSWWRKFVSVVQDLGNLLSVGQNAAQVGQGIAGFLNQ